MHIFSGIFFEVQACDGDVLDLPFDRVPGLIPFGRHDLELAVGREWSVILRNLIALGKIRVEVILARKNGLAVYVKPEREGRARAEFDRATIQDGKSAG